MSCFQTNSQNNTLIQYQLLHLSFTNQLSEELYTEILDTHTYTRSYEIFPWKILGSTTTFLNKLYTFQSHCYV